MCRILLPGIIDYEPSKKFENLIHRNGIKHITNASYHPSLNGTAQRAVQTFKSAIR